MYVQISFVLAVKIQYLFDIQHIYLKYFLHLQVMGNAHGEVSGQISVTTALLVLAGAEDHQ